MPEWWRSEETTSHRGRHLRGFSTAGLHAATPVQPVRRLEQRPQLLSPLCLGQYRDAMTRREIRNWVDGVRYDPAIWHTRLEFTLFRGRAGAVPRASVPDRASDAYMGRDGVELNYRSRCEDPMRSGGSSFSDRTGVPAG